MFYTDIFVLETCIVKKYLNNKEYTRTWYYGYFFIMPLLPSRTRAFCQTKRPKGRRGKYIYTYIYIETFLPLSNFDLRSLSACKIGIFGKLMLIFLSTLLQAVPRLTYRLFCCTKHEISFPLGWAPHTAFSEEMLKSQRCRRQNQLPQVEPPTVGGSTYANDDI